MSDSEVLSDNEMDALMNGVEDGEVEAEQGIDTPEGKISRYDFAHPSYKLNSRLPVLDVINEKLAKILASSLSNSFHQEIKVTAKTPGFEKYQDYAHSLPVSVSVAQINIQPLQGNALFCLEGKLIFMLVDTFFGGSGSLDDDPAAREFTPTEQRIIDRTREMFFSAVTSAWEPVLAVKPAFHSVMSSSQVTSPANPAAVVVTHKFEIELASGTGECHLVTPFSMLEPVRPQLTNDLQKMRGDDAKWIQSFTDCVKEAELDIEGVIGETEITLNQLLNLKAGDFIPLGQSQTVTFSSEGILLFDAEVCVSNGLVSASLSRWHRPLRQ